MFSMRTLALIKRNLGYHWRTNLAVVLGVATAVSVLAGALIVGESVRVSLRDLVLTRLGRTAFVVTAPNFFDETVARRLALDEEFGSLFQATLPLIVLDGFVVHEDSSRRAGGVKVYGVDKRFWEFHGQTGLAPKDREVLVSPSLARELGSEAGDTLLLRVEQPSVVPGETLHGRRDQAGQLVRVSMREVLPVDRLGEFSLSAHQGEVRAVFVPLLRLQKDLDRSLKVNTLLISTEEDSGGSEQSASAAKRIEQALDRVLSLTDLGVRARILDTRPIGVIESDGVLIGDVLAEAAAVSTEHTDLHAQPIFTYLVNSIAIDNYEIPYSLVTAIEFGTFFDGLRTDFHSPIVLNSWAAEELEAEVGDTVELTYYIWLEEGRLETKQAEFQVAAVVPLDGEINDRNLAPSYPGITEAESLGAWDPPFSIDLSRVRPEDEEYWDLYRTTPKAFIPLNKGRELWSSRYGGLTSIRLHLTRSAGAKLHEPTDSIEMLMASYIENLKSALDPVRMGFVVRAVRADSLRASRGATDFGEYFVYFSFFLVVSALLLTAFFFKLGIEQRLREVGLLRAIGFTEAHVRMLFMTEGIVLSTMGGLVGVVGAVSYGALVMLGLRTWWVDAVGTTLLTVHLSQPLLLLGVVGGVVAAIVCTWITLRSVVQSSPRALITGVSEAMMVSMRQSKARGFFWTGLLGLLSMLLLVAALMGFIDQAAGFFGGGASLLVFAVMCASIWLTRNRRRVIVGTGWWVISRVGFRNASCRVGRSVLCIALIASASFIIVSVDAFRKTNKDEGIDYRSGNGGFSLFAESLIPLYHDLNDSKGREELSFPIDEEGRFDAVKFMPFRVRPGDDASCLNLYRPDNPRILAPSENFLKAGRFTFRSVLAASDVELRNPWQVLNRDMPDGVIPVVGDANSMTYVLHLGLGDDIVIDVDGNPVRLRLVGMLDDSLFQGELLMSETNFLSLFQAWDGYRFFLLDVSVDSAPEIASMLERNLSDYGFDVMLTQERIASFQRVENTYLSTFQVLGGLGLLLGTIGLAAVLLRNVLERRRELALMRAVGYDIRSLMVMVVAENVWLLFWGLFIGAVCALLSIAPVIASRGGDLPALSLVLFLPLVLVSGSVTSVVAMAVTLRSPLLQALRAE